MLILIKRKEVKYITELAKHLNYERHTIGEWLKKYNNGGFNNLLLKNNKTNARILLTESDKKKIKTRQSDLTTKFTSYIHLLNWVNHFNKDVTYAALYKFASKINVTTNSNYK
jgi:transposase